MNTKIQNIKLLPMKKGFTLIEIMVSVSIFSIIMMIAIGSVLAIVSANRKSQALNSVMTNLNFALEGLSRDLRTGFDYDCDPTTSGLDDCPSGNSRMVFNSIQYGDRTEYYLQNGTIYKSLDSGDTYPLTSSDVNITNLTFYIKNTASATDPSPDYAQPKIIISVKGSFKGYGSPTEFHVQTTVSQRKLDI